MERYGYPTSYSYLITERRSKFLVPLVYPFPPQYRKLVYMALQFAFTILFLPLAYLCYTRYVLHSMAASESLKFNNRIFINTVLATSSKYKYS